MENNCEVNISFTCIGDFNCKYNDNNNIEFEMCKHYYHGYCSNLKANNEKMHEIIGECHGCRK
jgi:hypothetical protein